MMNFDALSKLEPEVLDQMVNHLEGSLSPQASEKLLAKIASNSDYKAVFKQLQLNYTDDQYSEFTPDMQKSWETIQSATKERVLWYKKPSVASIAAAAVLFFAFFSGWFINQMVSPEHSLAANENQFVADTLPNGGIVYLYPSSKLNAKRKGAFTKDQLFHLEGNAFFNLPNDSEMELVLSAGGTNLRLKGSSFKINTSDSGEEISIQVEDGLCEVSVEGRKQDKLLVYAGEKAFFNTESQKIRKEKKNDDIYLIYQP